MDDVA